MKEFKKFKKHRWFIWVIVLSVAGLGGLATYIYSVSASDEAQVPVMFGKAQNVVTSKAPVKLPVTQTEATYLVKNIPQVQEYLRTHSQARVTPESQINKDTPQTPYWQVHVYQDFKDHTQTFAWYNIYSESGVIVKK